MLGAEKLNEEKLNRIAAKPSFSSELLMELFICIPYLCVSLLNSSPSSLRSSSKKVQLKCK
ncbi:hypothetical protein VDIAB_220240 [Vibrio diabolicus]|nr:hypothetical protein VDIAB_220240 [Vibrio diabolicus]